MVFLDWSSYSPPDPKVDADRVGTLGHILGHEQLWRETLADPSISRDAVRRSVEGFRWERTVDGVQAVFEGVCGIDSTLSDAANPTPARRRVE